MRVACFFLILIFFSCSNKTDKDLVLDLSKRSECINYSDFVDSLRYIRFETSDESIIGNINKVFRDDTMMFIYDGNTESIFIFNESGRFINKICDIGRGPGEYINISACCLDRHKRRIIIYNDRLDKVLRFSYNGKFIDERIQKKRMLFDGVLVKENGNYLCFSKSIKRCKDYSIWEMDSLLNFKKGIRQTDLRYQYPFNYRSIYSKCNGKLSFFDYYTHTIYSIENEPVKSLLAIDLKQKVSDDVLKKPNLEFKNGKLVDLVGKSFLCYNFLETKRKYFLYFHSRKSGEAIVLLDKKNKKTSIGKCFKNDIDEVKSPNKFGYFADNVLYSVIYPDDSELNPCLQLLYFKN